MSYNKFFARRAGAIAIAGLMTASQFAGPLFATDAASGSSSFDASDASAIADVPDWNPSDTGEQSDIEEVKTPVSAAIINKSKTGSLVIHKYDVASAENDGVDVSSFAGIGEPDAAAEDAFAPYALQGVVFSCIRVGGIETLYTTPVGGSQIQVVYRLPASLADLMGLKVSAAYTSAQINDALAQMLASDVHAKSRLEAWMKDQEATELEATDKLGVAVANNMPVGLYLVVETKVPQDVPRTTDPFFVSVPMTDFTGSRWNYSVSVYPKNQKNEPVLDKLVKDPDTGKYGDTASVSEGSDVEYAVVIKVPETESEASYLTQFEIEDKIPAGQKYNDPDKIEVVFYEREDDAKNDNRDKAVGIWTGEDGAKYFTPIIQEDETGDKLIINPTADGLREINQNYPGHFMVVTYTTKMGSDAKVVLGDNGNVSPVSLTYARTNETYHRTIDDEVAVYTYGIDLNKKFKGGKGNPQKVEFVIKDEDDGQYLKGKLDNGVYYVTETTSIMSEATAFVPDANGELHIYGMEADTYTLTETRTAEGFSKLKEPLKLAFDMTDSKIARAFAQGTETESGETVPQVVVVNGAAASINGAKVDMQELFGSPDATVGIDVTNNKKPKNQKDDEDEAEPDKDDDDDDKKKSGKNGSGGSDGGSSRNVHLPNTGDAGKIAVSIVGLCAVAGGAYLVVKSRKSDTEAPDGKSVDGNDDNE